MGESFLTIQEAYKFWEILKLFSNHPVEYKRDVVIGQLDRIPFPFKIS